MRRLACSVAMVSLILPLTAPPPVLAQRSKSLPALVHSARDDLFLALERGDISEGTYALERFRSLGRPERVRARYGRITAADPRSATLLLRDVSLRLDDLSGQDRAEAEAVLARPTDGGGDLAGDGYATASEATCSTNLCFHWVETTADAPPPADGDSDSIPDWVETTMSTFEQVWQKEVVELGYRAPKSDLSSENHGPDGRLDVYLAQLGDEGLFGYCASDDPNADPDTTYPFYDVSGYCVVDNDFVGFPRGPLASLQVTAAHEFFHAVQYAYDFFDDAWLLEGTAAWIEDEVFDAVNDNYQYLANSPLRQSRIPLDFAFGPFQYGSWIFWRFLTEALGPTVVRDVWNRADGSQGGPDMYSLQATTAVLAQRGTPLRDTFADFGVANFLPGDSYEEGKAYPKANKKRPRPISLRLSGGEEKTRTIRLHHLTHDYVVFRPAKGLSGSLAIDLNLPPLSHGSEATLIIRFASGRIRLKSFTGNAQGDQALRVPFGGEVRDVVLVLTNASNRFRSCFQQATPLSCSGIPVDDGQDFRLSARVIQ